MRRFIDAANGLVMRPRSARPPAAHPTPPTDAAAADKAKASQGSSTGGSSGGSGGSASKGAAAPAAVPALAPEELPLGRRLGGGSFGDVHEAAWRGTPVAVKLIRAGDEGLTAEARAARRLQRAPRRPAAARQQAAR